MTRRKWNRTRTQAGASKPTLLKERETKLAEASAEYEAKDGPRFYTEDEVYQILARESLAQVDRAIGVVHDSKHEIMLLKSETRSLLKELMAA